MKQSPVVTYAVQPPLSRPKEDQNAPTKKNIMVLNRSDVTIRNNTVFMPYTHEIAQLKKPENGQFKNNVEIFPTMSENDIKGLLIDNFPCLENKRFYCASAADNRRRLEFHGEPRIWNGRLIKQKIKSKSVLYIFTDEERFGIQHRENDETSGSHYKELQSSEIPTDSGIEASDCQQVCDGTVLDTLSSGSTVPSILADDPCSDVLENEGKQELSLDDNSVPDCQENFGNQNPTSSKQRALKRPYDQIATLAKEDGNHEPSPPTGTTITQGISGRTICSLALALPHSDSRPQGVVSSTLTPQMNSLSISTASFPRVEGHVAQTVRGGHLGAHSCDAPLEAITRQSDCIETARVCPNQSKQSYEVNAEPSLLGTGASVNNATYGHQEKARTSGSDYESQSSDVAEDILTDSGIEASGGLYLSHDISQKWSPHTSLEPALPSDAGLDLPFPCTMPRQWRNINRRNAVLDRANAPAEPTDYSTLSTEALRLMLGERHLQQTGNRSELISRLQQQQRPPALQPESAPSNSSVAAGVPHAELAALIASIVDEQMNCLVVPNSLGPVLRATCGRTSGPVLLHRHKMAAKTLHVNVNNLHFFTFLQQVISQTPPILLVSPLPPVLLPSPLRSTFPIQPKSRRFTRTSNSLPSPAI